MIVATFVLMSAYRVYFVFIPTALVTYLMKHSYRPLFSFFDEHYNGVYLDSAATTQKLDAVLAYTDEFARKQNASVHRSAYPLANRATAMFESARSDIAKLIGALSSDEIVFTSGATESLNMIASGIPGALLNGNTILLCESEHHANILPWQALAKRLGLEIKVLPLSINGTFTDDTLSQWLQAFTHDVAIFACAHVSNVLGNIYPIQLLCEKAKEIGAISVIDGTQAVAHISVNVQLLSCDFYVFSGHKMYAPTGIGICWGRYSLLNKLNPSKLGGEMVTKVTFKDFLMQPPPLKFEAGTPNILGALGLHQASIFIANNLAGIQAHELDLYHYLYQKLMQVRGIQVLGNYHQSIGVISFYAPERDNHAIAMQLYQQGVALRFGQHCAMPLMQSLGLSACLRVSLACYNDQADVDFFIGALVASLCNLQEAPSDKGSLEVINDAPANAWELKIKQAVNWPEKHRQLLLLSNALPLLAASERSSENAVQGCEARVWLTKEPVSGLYRAYADSKVIRGILAVLLLKHQQIVESEDDCAAADFDYLAYLKSIGLSDYFSVGRKDGVQAVLGRMRHIDKHLSH